MNACSNTSKLKTICVSPPFWWAAVELSNVDRSAETKRLETTAIEDLSNRFEVSTPTVSRVFENWVTVMSNNLEILIVWLSREQLQKTMPCLVAHYGNKVLAILDCFEIFVDRPLTKLAMVKL